MKFIDYNTINTIIPYLLSPELQMRLLPIKLIFMILVVFFLGFIIFALLRTHYLEWLYLRDAVEFFTHRPFGAKKMTHTWNNILKRLETGAESEYKLAVIGADNMLDSSLKRMGYAGETLEDRLAKLTSATLPNIENLHQVHKTRNEIVRNPDYRLALDEARKSLDVYQKAFQDLHILGE